MGVFRAAFQNWSAGTALSSLFLGPRRLGFYLAGVCAVAGMAGWALHTPKTPQAAQLPVQTSTTASQPALKPASASPATTSTTLNVSAGNSGKPVARLNVNGKPVPIPASGSSSQTVVDAQGNSTTVNVSSDSSQTGDGQNSSTSSFSLDVQSSSETEGGS